MGILYELDKITDCLREGFKDLQSTFCFLQRGLQLLAVGFFGPANLFVEGLDLLDCFLAFSGISIL